MNHAILLTKLGHYGIRGTSLEWFGSYLNERKQYVHFNGQSSELKYISCGVPQGFAFGPLLFLIYINDLPNVSKILNFYLFADDTNIYHEADNVKDLERAVNKELKWLNQWPSVNCLALNISKTNLVIFHTYNKPVQDFITLNKKTISEKYHVSKISWCFTRLIFKLEDSY